MKRIKYTALVMATIQKIVTVEVDAEGAYEAYDPDAEAELEAIAAYEKEYGEANEIEVVALVEEEYVEAHREQLAKALQKENS